jgi:hypothetical protein
MCGACRPAAHSADGSSTIDAYVKSVPPGPNAAGSRCLDVTE